MIIFLVCNTLAYKPWFLDNNPKTTFGSFCIELTPLLCIGNASEYTYVCNGRAPLALRFFGRNRIQRPCWTSLSYANYIGHHFRPKWFVEILSMKHIPCHISHSAICMFHHLILLRPIWGRHCISMSWSLKKPLECLGNIFSSVVRPKNLDFVLRLYLCKHLEHLKILFFRQQRIQPRFLQKILNEGYKMSCNTHKYGLHGATHMECIISNVLVVCLFLYSQT